MCDATIQSDLWFSLSLSIASCSYPCRVAFHYISFQDSRIFDLAYMPVSKMSFLVSIEVRRLHTRSTDNSDRGILNVILYLYCTKQESAKGGEQSNIEQRQDTKKRCWGYWLVMPFQCNVQWQQCENSWV
jgi:hypothetical protein